MSMRRPYQITATVLLFLAGFTAFESLQLRYYSKLGPGPGFFPFWLAVLLGVLAITILLQATFGQPEPMPSDFFASRTGYIRMGAVVLALVGTIMLMEPLGFRLTMLAMYVFLLYTFGQRGLTTIALVSLAGSFGVYYVFVQWLQVPLPKGLLGF